MTRKGGQRTMTPLQKVNPLLDIIRNTCKSVYHPKQHISVDERMVATKARISIKQNMKAKPTKWRLKCFVLADVNGYTLDYRLYTRKTHGASGKGLSFDVVSELVNKDYLGSGYIVYCDNFYTSPLLFRHLSQQGFGASGNYRQGRVGVPTIQENALDRKSKRGSIRWIRDGDLLFVKWMDTRELSLCSTVHPVYTGENVLRRQKTDGHSQRVPVPRPTAVGDTISTWGEWTPLTKKDEEMANDSFPAPFGHRCDKQLRCAQRTPDGEAAKANDTAGFPGGAMCKAAGRATGWSTKAPHSGSFSCPHRQQGGHWEKKEGKHGEETVLSLQKEQTLDA